MKCVMLCLQWDRRTWSGLFSFSLSFLRAREVRWNRIGNLYVCEPVTLWVWSSAKIFFLFWKEVDYGLQRGIGFIGKWDSPLNDTCSMVRCLLFGPKNEENFISFHYKNFSPVVECRLRQGDHNKFGFLRRLIIKVSIRTFRQPNNGQKTLYLQLSICQTP
jgi:hypothetical protein